MGIKTERIVVDKPSILELFRVCSEPHCGSIIDQEDVLILTVGAAVTVKTACLQNHHQQTWSSSTAVGEGHKRQFVINILLAAYTLFCGLNISQVSEIISQPTGPLHACSYLIIQE